MALIRTIRMPRIKGNPYPKMVNSSGEVDMPNIVTAKEVGQYLKLSESTIYKLATNGEIPGFKIGDSWRFDMEDILKLIRDSKMESSNHRRNKDA
jgi:excisionase family DNA binding protein